MNSMKYTVVIVVFMAVIALGYPKNNRDLLNYYPFPYVPREDWNAKPPSSVSTLVTPVSHVVIHHTYTPGVCLTKELCMQYMRSIQNTHQNENGWNDFGYNFAVGGEGTVYEGRGWETLGAHSAGFNSQSIGIVLIGDFVTQLPPAIAIETAKQLIAKGVELGYIKADYKLVGHRQVKSTECPGDRLFAEIQTWDHFSDSL